MHNFSHCLRFLTIFYFLPFAYDEKILVWCLNLQGIAYVR